MVDTVWRLHAYLDSVGLCHFCKKHCGSAHRACPNPMDKSRVEIPASFVPPPKPADYTPPVAWTSKNSGPAKTNPSTAGRPIGRPAGVAGLTNEAPDLDELSASCLARVDGHLDELAHGFANWHLTAVEDDMQAAAIAGDPDAIKTLAVSSATRDDEFIPEAPQFDEASFLKACGAIAESRSAKYVQSPLRPTHQFHRGRCLRGSPIFRRIHSLPLPQRTRSPPPILDWRARRPTLKRPSLMPSITTTEAWLSPLNSCALRTPPCRPFPSLPGPFPAALAIQDQRGYHPIGQPQPKRPATKKNRPPGRSTVPIPSQLSPSSWRDPPPHFFIGGETVKPPRTARFHKDNHRHISRSTISSGPRTLPSRQRSLTHISPG